MWIAESDGHRSYFENAYGEQWVCVTEANRLRISGGDIGWETIEIAAPDYAALALEIAGSPRPMSWTHVWGHIFNAEEALWLRAVLTAAAQARP